MKRFTRIMLILAAIFGALGMGFTVAGAAMGGASDPAELVKTVGKNIPGTDGEWLWVMSWDDDDWDDDDRDDDDWDDHDHHGTAAVPSSEDGDTRVYEIPVKEELELDLSYEELIIEEYDGETIRIEVEDDPSGYVTVREEARTLKVESAKKKHTRSIHISYPAGTVFSSVELDLDAGSGTLTGNLEADEVEISVGAGDFSNDGTIKARSLDVSVGMGEAELSGVTASDIDGECGIGALNLELSGKETDYSYKLECGVGSIEIGDSEYGGFAMEKTIRNDGSGIVELECGMGEIVIDFV